MDLSNGVFFFALIYLAVVVGAIMAIVLAVRALLRTAGALERIANALEKRPPS